MPGQNVMVEVKNIWNSEEKLAERKTNQKRHKWAIEDFGTTEVLLTVCTMTNIDMIKNFQQKITCILMFYRFKLFEKTSNTQFHTQFDTRRVQNLDYITLFPICDTFIVTEIQCNLSNKIVKWYNNSIFLQLSGFIHCISIDLILSVRNCDVLYAHVKKHDPRRCAANQYRYADEHYIMKDLFYNKNRLAILISVTI